MNVETYVEEILREIILHYKVWCSICENLDIARLAIYHHR